MKWINDPDESHKIEEKTWCSEFTIKSQCKNSDFSVYLEHLD